MNEDPDQCDAPATNELAGATRLQACPRCGYSLEGLPTAHRCPECGFKYDDQTFVLTGISRGTSGMHPGRKWLWLLAGLTAWLMPQAAMFVVGSRFMSLLILAVVVFWIGLIVLLILTSRRERRGIETFLFTAGGFGHCADIKGDVVNDARMVPWHDVDTVIVQQKGAQWCRIRVGAGGYRQRLRRTLLDVGVRCNPETAEWIRHTLCQRMAAARGTTL